MNRGKRVIEAGISVMDHRRRSLSGNRPPRGYQPRWRLLRDVITTLQPFIQFIRLFVT